jgi:hypothetical protein
VTEQEYLDSIKNRSYPDVVRTTEPLLIRFSKTSLLVGDVNFYAKIKKGLAFTGYDIYMSGLGTPVSETKLDEDTATTVNNVKVTKSSNWKLDDIENDASKTLDILEARIAIKETSNEIKRAIDRLCWQLHYDITGSDANKPTDNFSDVDIAKITYPTTGASTVYGDYRDLITKIGTLQVDVHGDFDSLKGSLDNINTSIGTTLNGTMIDINTSIGTTLDGTLSTMNTSIVNVGNKIIGTSDNNTIGFYINKVATNLKADTDTYTISKALRDTDTSDTSVSHSVYQQTQLENDHFTTISVDQLGAFGADVGGGNSNKTLFDTIGSYGEYGNSANISDYIGELDDVYNPNAQDKKQTLFGYSNLINNKMGDSNSAIDTNTLFGCSKTIDGKIGVSNDSNLTTLFNIIGTNADGSAQTNTGTLFYEILHRAGTRNLNNAQIESDSPFGKVLYDTTTILNDITTIKDRIGNNDDSYNSQNDPSLTTTVFGKLNRINSTVRQQRVNELDYMISRSTLPVNYGNNLW